MTICLDKTKKRIQLFTAIRLMTKHQIQVMNQQSVL